MASVYQDKKLVEHLDKINEKYDELDILIQTTHGKWQSVNPKIQKKLKEIEKVRLDYLEYINKYRSTSNGKSSSTLAERAPFNRYPSILDPKFNHKLNLHSLIRQYQGVYDGEQLAARLYALYSNSDNKNQPSSLSIKKYGNKNKDGDGDGNGIKMPNLDVEQGLELFKLTPAQKMLRNFMAPGAPYRSILIDHGTGVGKTCTAITIAENLKSATKNSGRIYVIRPDEFQRQLFEPNKVMRGKKHMQCTGETYLDEISRTNPKAHKLVEDCELGRKDDCTRMEKMVKTQIAKYYDFNTKYTWAQKINKVINTRTTGLTGVERHKKMVATIRLIFNNSVLIIDEAHNMRNSAEASSGGAKKGELKSRSGDIKKDEIVEDSKGSNFIINILRKVLLYSQNMRLILLSATPMFDKPQDIVPLINYMLLNDKRPEVRQSDIFKDGKLDNKNKLLQATRGYISYIRGNDPYNFPIRLTATANLPDSDIMDPKKYPKLDILGKKLPAKYHNCKYLPLVKCSFTKDHQDALMKLIGYKPTAEQNDNKIQNKALADDMTEGDIEGVITDDGLGLGPDMLDEERGFSVAYTSEIQMGNFLYQSLKESGGNPVACYGESGKNAVLESVGGNSFRFRDNDYGRRFMMPLLEKHGPKLAKCMEQILACDGPVFVYTYFTASGVIPMAIALEMAGFKRYGGEKPLIASGASYRKSEPDTKDGRNQYIIYTGDKQLSRGAKSFFDKREAMTKDKKVKVVIASRKGSEGLNLFGFREMHILDPWHNMNLLEQTVGRVIRNKSHHHLPPSQRNVVVYNYATVLTGKYKDRESVDQRVYSIAEDKAVSAGHVEELLKSNAIDCTINRPLNQRPKSLYKAPVSIITGQGKKLKHSLVDKPYSKETSYMAGDMEYKCIGELSLGEKKGKSNEWIPDEPINVKQYEIEIREILAVITSRLSTALTMLERDAIQITKAVLDSTLGGNTHTHVLAQIYAYIRSELDTDDALILDKYNRECRLVVLNGGKNGGVYRLIPTSQFDPKQSLVAQNRPKFVKKSGRIGSSKAGRLSSSASIGAYEIIDRININPLVQKVRKEKDKLKDKEKLSYKSILTNMENIINGIIYQIDSERSSSSASKTIGVARSSVSSSEIASKSNIYTNFMTIYNTNVPLTSKMGYDEVYKLVFDRLILVDKLHVLKNLVYRIKRRERLDKLERRLLKVMGYSLVSKSEILGDVGSDMGINYINEPDRLYGFIIAGFNSLMLYKFNDDKAAKIDGESMQSVDKSSMSSPHSASDDALVDPSTMPFDLDKTNTRKLINKRWALLQGYDTSDLFGFMIYTNNTSLPPVFKIMDYISHGRKKWVKGANCSSKNTILVIDYIKKVEPKYRDIGYKFSTTKRIICGDLEMFFRMADSAKKNKERHFLSPEEYKVYIEKSGLG